MSMIARIVKNCVKNIGYAVSRNPLPGWYHKDPFLAQKYLLRDQAVHTIFDVGANVGQSAAEYVELFPSARVCCFEPVPATFQKLKDNTRHIGRVESINRAVSDTVGTARIFLTDAATMNSLLPMCDESRHGSEIEVPTITLDRFCDDNGIQSVQILKIDVQGGERFALAGAKGLLSRHAIDLVYTEVLFSSLYREQTQFHELYACLFEAGYSLFGFYELRVGEMLQVHHGNVIFISPKIQQHMAARFAPSRAAA